MACRTPADPSAATGDAAAGGNGGAAGTLLNNTRRIAELKKKLVLAEGQKKAFTGDWTQRDKQTADTLADLKKEVKRLTAQLLQLKTVTTSRTNRPSTTVVAGAAARAAPKCNDDAVTAAVSAKASETAPTCVYPVGARTAADAVRICDLQHIQSVKQLDLMNARYAKRAQLFDQLYERYQELQSTVPASSNPQRIAATGGGGGASTSHQAADAASSSVASTSAAQPTTGPGAASAPSTLTELQHRQRIAHLENHIHRTQVQWMEAEHIRKKYRSISAALHTDAERFERTLQQLESAQRAQDAEIERMQRAHLEAQHLRDGTKVALMRQEHGAGAAQRQRERQALECRRQVEERKAELERLERRLFAVPATGGDTHHGGASSAKKTMASSSRGGRPGSSDSHADNEGTGDETSRGGADGGQHRDGKAAGAKRLNSAERARQQQLHTLELQFKGLMEQTGATSAGEVLQRYMAQRESSARLGYLRTVAETEKQQLEQSRERLGGVLETSKFAAVKETDENQDDVERLKRALSDEDALTASYASATEHSGHVIDTIQQTLLDLILKLQEVDEIIEGLGGRGVDGSMETVDFELADLLSGNVDDVQLLRILESKFRKGIAWVDDQSAANDAADPLDTDPNALQLDDLLMAGSPTASRPATSAQDDRERPQAFPSCYSGLMAAGRMSSSVGGGVSAGAAGASVTPGQVSQSLATDDEAEVPSRGFIKRQAQSIVDAKSRRKGFRAPRR